MDAVMTGVLISLYGWCIWLAICAGWLLMLTLAAGWVWDRQAEKQADLLENRDFFTFLMLIPAHNEEKVIGPVLERLRQTIRWPADKWEIVVVADNCTDETARIAAQHAQVLVRTDAVKRGKGQALHWAIEQFANWPRPFDAVIVIDADSMVNPGFLAAFQEKIKQGAGVAQAHDTVWNVEDSWRTSLMFAAFSAINLVRPLGRSLFGWSTGLKGNGMCFTREILLKYGHPAGSIAEDLEQGMRYLQAGIRVAFVPGAVVRAQMPAGAAAAVSQRMRWEGGRKGIARLWGGKFLGRFLAGAVKGHPDWGFLDAAMELLIPPVGNLCAQAALVLLVSFFVPRGEGCMIAAGGVLGAVAVYVWGAQILAQAPRIVYIRLVMAPVYVFWKGWIKIRRIITRSGKGEGWVRTSRD